MRDSIGSIYPIVIVLTFIIVISGVLAFSVNYNKAFKMKNQIVYILEKYDNNTASGDAQREIKEYANSIGYSASSEYTSICNNTKYTKDSNSTGWCYQKITTSNDERGTLTNGGIREYETTYVNVKTFVSIDVPVFNKIFKNIGLFQVTGSTKKITKLNN